MLMTLVFPDSLSNTFPRNAPLPNEVFANENDSVQLLPTTGNPLHPISQDTTLAFSVPRDEASVFLARIQELPVQAHSKNFGGNEADISAEPTRWIMKAANDNGHPVKSSFGVSASNAWVGFVDLVKVGPLQGLKAVELTPCRTQSLSIS